MVISINQRGETETLEPAPQSSSDPSVDTKPEKIHQEKPDVLDGAEKTEAVQGNEEVEEEETECGLCLFMKGGGCRDAFISWEKCIEEEDVSKCFEVYSLLRKCMEAHADYYEPILRAEKAAQDEAVKELEKEKEKEKAAAEAEESKDLKGKENVEGN